MPTSDILKSYNDIRRPINIARKKDFVFAQRTRAKRSKETDGEKTEEKKKNERVFKFSDNWGANWKKLTIDRREEKLARKVLNRSRGDYKLKKIYSQLLGVWMSEYQGESIRDVLRGLFDARSDCRYSPFHKSWGLLTTFLTSFDYSGNFALLNEP